jgi:predicted peptidase
VPDRAGAWRSARVSAALPHLLAHPVAPAEPAGGRWPLVVFLHGSAERGADLALVERHGPPRLVRDGRAFPAFVASPQAPSGRWWEPRAVKALVDALLAAHPIDPDRVVLTGLSMGGFGTLEAAAEHPDTFAAIAPICGGFRGPVARLRRLARTPCWLFHGAHDDAVPLARSAEVHAALLAQGAPVKLTVYPDAGHDAWTRTYASDAFWRWLLGAARGLPAVPFPPDG